MIIHSFNPLLPPFQSENQRLEEEKENMKRELSMEKEKLHTLEQAMQEYGNLQGALLLVSLIFKGIV